MKILVVHDERATADSIAEVLRRNGHQVLPLYNALEAVEHAEHLTFDAALITRGQGASFFELGDYLHKLMPRCKLIFVISPDILWFAQGVVDRGMVEDFAFLPEGFKIEDLLQRLGETSYRKAQDYVLQR